MPRETRSQAASPDSRSPRHPAAPGDLGKTLHDIAHDFNNVLAAILGSAHLARTGLDAAHPSFVFFQEIEKAAKRAKDTVQRLRALAAASSHPAESPATRVLVGEAERDAGPATASVRDEDPAVPDPRGSPSDDLFGRGERVLYLDDEEPLVFLALRFLERQGYRVSGFTSAREAIAALRLDAGGFDLVVVDQNMPELPGLEVALVVGTIRADLPVLLTSGVVTDALRDSAARAGIRHLIEKPASVEGLARAVRHVLASGRGERDPA